MRKSRVCPICGEIYTGVPALSRVDNKTNICPDCGTRQALNSIGMGAEEQRRVFILIHPAGRDR